MLPLRRHMVVVLAILWIALLLPIQLIVMRVTPRHSHLLPRLFHRGVCRLLRLKVEVRGMPRERGPTLIASNHVSWMDIIVLGSVVDACFVAKHEVATWPVFGLLAKCQRTVFIERRLRRTADHRDEMIERLEQGDNLILFPEGTSGDGLRVLPYKSAFFSLAERSFSGQPLMVQAVSLAFVQLNNMPVGRRATELYAWVGDQDLLPHLWRYLAAGPGRVVVEFHAPVTIEQFASRKDLASFCRDATRLGIDRAKTGRLPRPAPQPAPQPAPALSQPERA